MVLGNTDAVAAWLAHARVLVIDDEQSNLDFLRHVLATEGYGELITMTDAAAALEAFGALDPDVVVTDLMMPGLDGFEIIARLRAVLPADAYLPILVATADHAPETRRRALSVGARDFLTKPLSPAEVRLRVRNLLETRYLHEQLRENNLLLEHRVTERTHELEEARLEILFRLARAAEFRDDATGQHTLRVGRMSSRMAQVLGLPVEVYELIERAAPLHDIGKIGIPDAILLKPGRLDASELAIMQAHTEIGANILAGSRSQLLQLAEQIALSHHERWDGAGYPRQLSGEEIPLASRIVAVADVFDSLTHDRPYKSAWTIRDALTEIQSQAGRQFDPAVVEALLRVVPEAGTLETAASAGRSQALPPCDSLATLAVPAVLARVHAMETEREALLREVKRLQGQVARRDKQLEKLRRAAKVV